MCHCCVRKVLWWYEWWFPTSPRNIFSERAKESQPSFMTSYYEFDLVLDFFCPKKSGLKTMKRLKKKVKKKEDILWYIPNFSDIRRRVTDLLKAHWRILNRNGILVLKTSLVSSKFMVRTRWKIIWKILYSTTFSCTVGNNGYVCFIPISLPEINKS